MGAGKTTLADEVARRLNRQLIEVDRLIEQKSGRSIPELFAQGESVFREHEVRVTRGVLANPRPSVVDLGGGSVKSPEVLRLLHDHATTVWIDTDLDTCWDRDRKSTRLNSSHT